VILDAKAMEWTLRLTGAARAHGWTVFAGDLRKQRPHDPSLMLLRGERLLAVYARTNQPRTPPPVQRFPDGVEVVVWTPADWPTVQVALAVDGIPGRGGTHH
jgi:hypothetical protein